MSSCPVSLVIPVIAKCGIEPPRSRCPARSSHLSYIATLFMNRGGDQPPIATDGIEPPTT